MSLSSRVKKVKPKTGFRELKVVETVSRKGFDTLKLEEDKTPRRQLKKGGPSTTRRRSSSPVKRAKVEGFDNGQPSFHLDGAMYEKRKTLVNNFSFLLTSLSDNLQRQHNFLEQFLGHEEMYLSHLLNLETAPNNLTCASCGDIEASFRCIDCYGPQWWCQECLLDFHTHHPFHRPQQWKEGSFENTSLCDLGYVFTLGHSTSGTGCCEEENLRGDRMMVLIHVNGVFDHCVRFCKCQGALSEHEQLFRHSLFSSTFDRPETAFSLDVLDYYSIDSMECKTSAQSFFQKLRRVTNNAFPEEVPVSSHSPTYVTYPTDEKTEQVSGIDQGQQTNAKIAGIETLRRSIRQIHISRKSHPVLPLMSSTWNKSTARLEGSPYMGHSSNDQCGWKFPRRSHQDEKT